MRLRFNLHVSVLQDAIAMSVRKRKLEFNQTGRKLKTLYIVFIVLVCMSCSSKHKPFANGRLLDYESSSSNDDASYVQENPLYVSSHKTKHDMLESLKRKINSRRSISTKHEKPSNDSDSPTDDDLEYDEYESESGDSILANVKVITKRLQLEKLTKRCMTFYEKNNKIILLMFLFLLFHHQLQKLAKSHAAHMIIPSPFTVIRLIFLLNALRRMRILPGQDGTPLENLFKEKFLGLFPVRLEAYSPPVDQHFMFERINDRYVRDQIAINKVIKADRCNVTITDTTNLGDDVQMYNETVVVVLDIKPDLNFIHLSIFRDALSFLIRQARNNPMLSKKNLNVVLVLESPGGSAQSYGIAAYELQRLARTPNVTLTVCVDKVAASGGYMLASQATPGNLIAAPFSLVGSIGVMGQTINVQKVLESFGVTPLVFKAGTHKAPVGIIGDVTEEGMATVQEMLDSQHIAFKQMISDSRGSKITDMEKVSTGEVWLAQDAVDLGLVDQIMSSQEYIDSKIERGATVLRLLSYRREPFSFLKAAGGGPSQPFASLACLQKIWHVICPSKTTIIEDSLFLS